MRTLGNILWLILAGWWLAIAYVIAGILNCITIIGIPFGIASFRIAGYALWPFGRVVIDRPGAGAGSPLRLLGNVIWFILGGLWLAIGHVVAGVLLCITIIGIPFGIASFKLAGLAIGPLGREIVSAEEAARRNAVVAIAVGGAQANAGPPA
jgi:uncharacterized membrane protein YccF (DUF307 family)